MGDVNRRLGFQLTVEFVEVELGIPHRDQDRRALLWWWRDLDEIRVRLIDYLKERRNGNTA